MKNKTKYQQFVPDWIRKFKEGHSFSQLSIQYKCSRNTVRNHLQDQGIYEKRIPVRNNHQKYVDNIKVNEVTGCWEWQGKTNNKGYGQFRLNGQLLLAHRYSYGYFIAQVGTLHVLHKCDNPPCSNPFHLFLGTHLENMQDKRSKGRNKVVSH
jgi:hypothetical protein